ncbi:hypothetical protein JET67_24045 [Pseudomonas palleroniana]|nr:hypothetical protein [Pseudomonas palleroniana]
MEFLIPAWPDFSTNPDPDFQDIVRVWMWPLDDPRPAEPFISLQIMSRPATGVPINIAQARRPPGAHLIVYEVFVFDIGNASESVPQLILIDLTPPYSSHVGPIPAALPPANLPTPATLAYFQSLPNETAMFSLPDYVANGRADGDYVLLYFNNSDIPYLPVPGNTDPKWPLPANLSFPLPLSVVQSAPDGFRSVRYELHDAADNPAKLSAQFSFDVALFPAPTGFVAPTVDLAVPGDSLINRSDAAQLNGAIIRIPPYQNFMRGNDGDIIRVTLATTLGTQTLPDVPLGSNPFPVQVHASFPTLVALYGATQGLLATTVSYAIQRRSVSYPSPLTTMFNLDIFVVGPPNPNEPDPVNPNLNPVVVRGEDMAGTEGNDNELLPEHANRPANAHITLWNTAPTPDALPFTIYLYYEGDLVDTQFVPSGMAGQTVTLHIPFSAVAKHNNGLKNVHYTIGAAGSSNLQSAPTTQVSVTANIINLDAPTVRHVIGAGNGTLNCTSFRPVGPPPGNIVVFIPPSQHFTLNMVVRLHWRGFSDDAGMNEVTSVAGFKDSLPLNQSMVNLGFEMELEDYFTRFKPIQPTTDDRLSGSARVHYSIVLPSGTVNSSEATPRVRGQLVGGTGPTFCDGTVVPAP